MSEESFKLLFQSSLENNVKELEYWSTKFRGKIPKSVKNRIEKLKYVSGMQYKAEQEKEKQKESKKDA
jgi:predicted transcriptional regulator|tara:strand:- start:261 stop:464 length:204 start_codon:yes stop_codon:yes gene_type:complete